jgi:hypothetical protein
MMPLAHRSACKRRDLKISTLQMLKKEHGTCHIEEKAVNFEKAASSTR